MNDDPETHTDSRAVPRTADADVTPTSYDEATDDPADGVTATFDYSPTIPVVGDPVSFDATASASEQASDFEWSFGDGATAAGERATYTFGSGGQKTVTLTVADDDGTTAEVRKNITVYRGLDATVPESDREDDLLPVVVRETLAFDPTEAVAVDSLRFGTPTAIAMGSGAAPVRTEERDGDLMAWFRIDETGLRGADGAARLAGRTTEGVPLAGLAEVTLPGQ